MLDKLIIISFTIGLIIVGGLAVFSIYLQLDEPTVATEEVATVKVADKEVATEQTCLERWDYLRLINKEPNDYKLIADNQELNMEFFITTGCSDSFREWMPELNSDWNTFVEWETSKKSKCELYLKGDLKMSEMFKPIMREMNCEEIVLQD